MSDDRSDVDARFAEIVAHWDDPDRRDPADAPTPPLLAGSDALTRPPHGEPHEPPVAPLPEPTASAASPAEPPVESPAVHPPPPPAGWREQVTPEAEEHFEPPPTQPLPSGDLHFWGILLGLCAGPLLLVYLIAFDREAGSLWTAVAILLTLGGFGLLVARQPRKRPDDGDDGARL